MLKKSIDVEISGQKYIIKSDAEEEYIHEIADYLNRKIEEVSLTTKTVDTLNLVILAALNIVNDLFRTRSEQGELKQWVESKSRRMISFIENQTDNGEFLEELS